MSGPADDARLGQFSNNGILRRAGLLWVGGDDFKVAPRAEREQGVLRASSGMHTAKRSANARALLDEGDSSLELAAAEKDVVEQRWHLIRRPRECRRGNSPTSNEEKDSSRNESQSRRLLVESDSSAIPPPVWRTSDTLGAERTSGMCRGTGLHQSCAGV
jgi:hypothetical protein